MSFDEQTLRDLLATPYGRGCALAVIHHVRAGNSLTITMIDGRVVTFDNPAEVRLVLREIFGWKRTRATTQYFESSTDSNFPDGLTDVPAKKNELLRKSEKRIEEAERLTTETKRLLADTKRLQAKSGAAASADSPQ